MANGHPLTSLPKNYILHIFFFSNPRRTWDFNLMNFVGFYLAFLIEHNHYTGSGGDMLEISAFVTNLLNKNIINLFRIVVINLGNKN